MADHADMQTHRATYERLIGLLKYGGVAVLLLAFVIIWLISGK